MDKLPDFDPVKIKCKSSDCENDKHCYRPKRGEWRDDGPRGRCQSCGDTNVDFALTHAYATSRPEEILSQLGREFIRVAFLDAPVDEAGRRQIRSLGYDGVRSRARGQIRSRIGATPNDWDGRQTPKVGSVLNLAQHATATCCRKCLYYWYGIPRDRALKETELEFCEKMLIAYLDRREGELRSFESKPGAEPSQ